MSISSFEGVAESLGYISGFNYMLESCRRLTISAVDQGIRPALSSAISKYHMTELARKVITHAMDVHAGHGIQLGPKNFIGSAHIAIPVSITVEGANILTRNLIIFGQGAIRCHPFVLAEIEQFSLKPSCERSIKLDKLLFSHIGRVVSLVIRNFWFGITGGRLIFSRYKDKTARYQRQLTRMSAAFALFADATLILLGGTLKRKERISARLGDILSHLYLGSAVLKYFHANKQPATDKIYLNWCLSYSLASIQQTIDELVQNYPSKFLGKVIRWLIFPFGRVYKMPPDKLHSLLVDSMIQPSGLRDRLTHLCYKNESLFSSSEQIDKALDQLPSVEPLFKRMHSALRNGEIDSSKSYEYQLQQAVKKNIVNATEAKKLREYNALYQNIIMVDEFSHDFERVLTKDQFSLKEEVV